MPNGGKDLTKRRKDYFEILKILHFLNEALKLLFKKSQFTFLTDTMHKRPIWWPAFAPGCFGLAQTLLPAGAVRREGAQKVETGLRNRDPQTCDRMTVDDALQVFPLFIALLQTARWGLNSQIAGKGALSGRGGGRPTQPALLGRKVKLSTSVRDQKPILTPR